MIPDFSGNVYQQGDSDYGLSTEQYAQSSFPAADTTPLMVAYPRTIQDIQAALKFAQDNGKKVVARSGGHQYCAKSSGGQDTIVLGMDAFGSIGVGANFVEVGPSVELTDLAASLKGRGLTIPHGECPLVCIGGHAQTGGYGHLLRSFGLAQDFVQELDIVLADGSFKTLTRPAPGRGPTNPDQDLFWGVLGGNAGSFGVITRYKFECIEASDHPNSYGYSAKRVYRQATFAALMKEVQTWTAGVAAKTLPAGIDFMMTVESAGRSPFPVLLVELVHANLGGATEAVDGDATFASIISASDVGSFFVERAFTTSGPKLLSDLSDSFVRRWPGTTLDGREFGYPYKKRINATSNRLNTAFITQFVTLIDQAVHTTGVKLVFQMLIGGGAYQNSNRRPATSIPHRDFVYTFVFDLFYEDGYEQTAVILQSQMQAVVDSVYSPGHEQRLFWGSFGDTNMSNPTVRDMYYDNLSDYQKLQALKRRVVPNNLFHTSFTVQP